MASQSIPKGERIRDLRVQQGMTQEKLARMSNVDVKTVYRAEQGEAPMRPETLLDIATALEVPLEEICDSRPAGPDTGADAEPEGHGNLVLRRVERASALHALAEGSEHYSWGFQVDPDEATAAAIRDVMQIVRRAIQGPERAADEFDAQGEFSEPARVARLKALIERLRDADVSVLANKFVHVEGSQSAVVLRVLFAPGQVERRKEYARFALPGRQGGDEMSESHSKVIEGVGELDFARRGNSVMGALELALHTIGDQTSYDELMGTSGMAFRLQMALPEWCPSAPYAGVGYDCVPHAAAALGRDIEWIPAEPAASDPMARRVEAIVDSIDRDVPVLYGAEECGLIVGYHHGGRQFSVRSYFDPSEMYSVLDRLDWPSPGILGDAEPAPGPEQKLHRSLELAVDLARCEQRFPTHHPGRHYACGFAAWEAWIDGLRDDERFQAIPREQLAVAIQANAWCYRSLIDARAAAGRYLGRAGDGLARIADLYERLALLLEEGLGVVPQPRAWLKDDGIGIGYRMQTGDDWPAAHRHQQADTLERGLDLERQAIGAIEALLE